MFIILEVSFDIMYNPVTNSNNYSDNFDLGAIQCMFILIEMIVMLNKTICS